MSNELEKRIHKLEEEVKKANRRRYVVIGGIAGWLVGFAVGGPIGAGIGTAAGASAGEGVYHAQKGIKKRKERK